MPLKPALEDHAALQLNTLDGLLVALAEAARLIVGGSESDRTAPTI